MVVARFCGVLFEVVVVNDVSQVHSILFNSLFDCMIPWMIHINKSFILCFKKSFSSFLILILYFRKNVHLSLLIVFF